MNKWKVPLNKPFFSNETKELVMNVLNSRMVSQGEMVEQFEEEVRKYVGAKYALAASSCTMGLWMVMREKDMFENIIPAFTFPAAHNAAYEMGRSVRDESAVDSVIDIDVNKNTYNMEETSISDTMLRYTNGESRIGGIIPIHQFGMPCDMETIRKFAEEQELFVLEDAACALGSEYKGKKIGAEGTAVFSFHGRKILTTGEGGMIVTDDEELYENCVMMRKFGKNKQGEFKGHGLNFKMSDVAAAMGIGQMRSLKASVRFRNRIADEYGRRMRKMEMVPPYTGLSTDYETNYQSYVIDTKDTGKEREAVLHKMRANGIEAQVGSYDQSHGTCKNSAELERTTIALPIWPEMTIKDINTVVNALEEALA